MIIKSNLVGPDFCCFSFNVMFTSYHNYDNGFEDFLLNEQAIDSGVRKLYGIFTFQKNLGNFTKDSTKIHDIKHHKIDLMDSEGYHFVY